MYILSTMREGSADGNPFLKLFWPAGMWHTITFLSFHIKSELCPYARVVGSAQRGGLTVPSP